MKLERPEESMKKEVVFHVPMGDGMINVGFPALSFVAGENVQDEKHSCNVIVEKNTFSFVNFRESVWSLKRVQRLSEIYDNQ